MPPNKAVHCRNRNKAVLPQPVTDRDVNQTTCTLPFILSHKTPVWVNQRGNSQPFFSHSEASKDVREKRPNQACLCPVPHFPTCIIFYFFFFCNTPLIGFLEKWSGKQKQDIDFRPFGSSQGESCWFPLLPSNQGWFTTRMQSECNYQHLTPMLGATCRNKSEKHNHR